MSGIHTGFWNQSTMADTQCEGGHTPAATKRTADVLSPTLVTPPGKVQRNVESEFVEGLLHALSDDRIKKAFETILTNVVKNELETLYKRVEGLEKQNTALKGKVNILETALNDMNERQDDLEQYGRRYSLRLHTDVPEEAGESTDDIILEATKKIGVNVTLNDISRSHRVGRRAGTKPRPIIFRLVSYRTRRSIYQNRKKLGGNVFITEDLTARRAHLLFLCRQLRRADKLQYVWSVDGRVLVKEHGETAYTVEIKRESDLSRFEQASSKMPSEA